VALPFKVASSSQSKQGGIMRLTRSPLDYNWATWPIYVVSLPTGNSGGRGPHHSPLLNMGPTLIPNDESGPSGNGFMVSPMNRLRSLASTPEFRCKLSTVLRRTPQEKARSPQKTSPLGEGWLSPLRWLPPPKLSKVG
jgi:hypothetical protein